MRTSNASSIFGSSIPEPFPISESSGEDALIPEPHTIGNTTWTGRNFVATKIEDVLPKLGENERLPTLEEIKNDFFEIGSSIQQSTSMIYVYQGDYSKVRFARIVLHQQDELNYIHENRNTPEMREILDILTGHKPDDSHRDIDALEDEAIAVILAGGYQSYSGAPRIATPIVKLTVTDLGETPSYSRFRVRTVFKDDTKL